jgi:hypothetical protein
VSVFAMGFQFRTGLFSPDAPSDVFFIGDDFKMSRINTVTDSAQMVDDEAWGNSPYEQVVENAVSQVHTSPNAELSVAGFSIRIRGPLPTGNLVVTGYRAYVNFGKDATEECSADWRYW